MKTKAKNFVNQYCSKDWSLLGSAALVLCLFSGGTTHADVKVPLKPFQKFLENYYLGLGQGWSETGAAFRCDFKVTALAQDGQTKEKLAGCFVSTLESELRGNAPVLSPLKRGSAIESAVARVLQKDDFATQFNNGLQGYGAVIRCYEPAGNTDKNAVAYCLAAPIGSLTQK